MTPEAAHVAGGPIWGKVRFPGYAPLTVDLLVERIDHVPYFTYRKHTYPIDAKGVVSRVLVSPLGRPGRGDPHERPGVGRQDQESRAECLVTAAPPRER